MVVTGNLQTSVSPRGKTQAISLGRKYLSTLQSTGCFLKTHNLKGEESTGCL